MSAAAVRQPNINSTARLAGSLYLLMMPFAAFSLYAQFATFIRDDAAATARNLEASQGMFLNGIATWLTAQTLSIFLVLALYKLLRPVNKDRALCMAALALIGVAVSMLNEVNHFIALFLTQKQSALEALTPEQIQDLILIFLHAHQYGTHISHVFWGLWLLPFGALVLGSDFLPRWLGILLVVAGLGYLVDLVVYLYLPEAALTVTQFTFLGEPLIALWLLFKGVDTEQWHRRATPVGMDG